MIAPITITPAIFKTVASSLSGSDCGVAAGAGVGVISEVFPFPSEVRATRGCGSPRRSGAHPGRGTIPVTLVGTPDLYNARRDDLPHTAPAAARAGSEQSEPVRLGHRLTGRTGAEFAVGRAQLRSEERRVGRERRTVCAR